MTTMTCMMNWVNWGSGSEGLKIFRSSMNYCWNSCVPCRPILIRKTGRSVRPKPSFNNFIWLSRKRKQKLPIGSRNSLKCNLNLTDGSNALKKLSTPKCKSFSKSRTNSHSKLRDKLKPLADNSMTRKKSTNTKSGVWERSWMRNRMWRLW